MSELEYQYLFLTNTLSAILMISHGCYALGPTCYTCQHITDPGTCNSITQCSSTQKCYQQTVRTGNSIEYHMGCLDSNLCPSSAGASLIGRRGTMTQNNKRQSSGVSLCSHCCTSDLCNLNLCNSQLGNTSSGCQDDPSFDCARLSATFDICKDPSHARTTCAKTCSLCSIDGSWTTWTSWSNCDVTCGVGRRMRTRTCTNPAPANGGLNCAGSNTGVLQCLNNPCPVHGAWSVWTSWNACSASCDVGLQSRRRSCTNPTPDKGGNLCFGDSLAYRMCSSVACYDGAWSSWTSWNTCTVTCGGGTKTRYRDCNNPAPSMLGKACSGPNEQTIICNNINCHYNTGSGLATPHSVIAFSAKGRSNANTEYVDAIFGEILLNRGGGYSNVTGRFTAPIRGIYSFTAQMCISNEHNAEIDFGIYSYRNSSFVGLTRVQGQDSFTCASTDAVEEMNSNDQVSVHVYSSHGTFESVISWNFFTGFLIESF